MRLIYMKSVVSPLFGRRNKFKLVYGAENQEINLNNNSPQSPTDRFCYDSFVVPNDFVEYKKEKRKKSSKFKRRRRVVTEISSDSDEN